MPSRLDPNPDVNELLRYNGARPRMPDIPTPKGMGPRPEVDGDISALWVAVPAVMGILMFLAIFAPELFR